MQSPQRTQASRSGLGWYLHRLRAMGPAEITQRVSRKLSARRHERQIRHSRMGDCGARNATAYPRPQRNGLDSACRRQLADEVGRIQAGKWQLFGHLPVELPIPPNWHRDPLADWTCNPHVPAPSLDHRKLPHGADVRVLWELNRWSELTRLAQASFELNDVASRALCISLLEDWVNQNEPMQGINWTSPMEGALRLINFAWIDALLADTLDDEQLERWSTLCRTVLPPHARWLWLQRSFGSSANNHLLGEFAGLAVVLARWPKLCKYATSIEKVRDEIARQIMLQFAADGGNLEQALHYHWFALELCWHAHLALDAAGVGLPPNAIQRLNAAACFFVEVAETVEPWDYGDSDDAHVVPLFASHATKMTEFRDWITGQSNSVSHWWPRRPDYQRQPRAGAGRAADEGWLHFHESGISSYRDQDWSLRFDHSPLGFGAMAAHGHLDALHLSVWLKGLAVIIDPGTGCYYHDAALRNHLASWQAHNGPRFADAADEATPLRHGPFLWAEHHPLPELSLEPDSVQARFDRPMGSVSRSIKKVSDGWEIMDQSVTGLPIRVNWQIAPEWKVEKTSDHCLHLDRENSSIMLNVSDDTELTLFDRHDASDDQRAICSRWFRSTCFGSRVELLSKRDVSRGAITTSIKNVTR